MGRNIGNASWRGSPGQTGPRTSPQEVVEEARNIDFNDEKAWKKFQEKHHERLKRDPDKTWNSNGPADDEVLHLIARDVKRFPDHRDFAKWAIVHHKQLLRCRGQGGYPPLHLALATSNHGFVSLVLEHAAEIGTLLEYFTASALTCLHCAIWGGSPFTEAILDIIDVGHGRISAARNTSSVGSRISGSVDSFVTTSTEASHEANRDWIPHMTPLHFAAASDLKSKLDEDQYTTCLSALGTLPNTTDVPETYSPHGNTAKGVTDGLPTQAPRLNIGSIRRDSIVTNSPVYDKNASLKVLEPKLDHSDGSQGFGHAQPPSKPDHEISGPWVEAALSRLKNKPQTFDPLAVTRKLIKARPEALFLRDSNDDTPFQARLRLLEEKITREEGPVKDQEELRKAIINEDDILRFMREYIIREYGRREALQALYTVGHERVLEFNLHGLPHSNIDADFLHGLSKVLRFEGLLKYVAIPQLTVESDGDLEVFDPEANDPGKGSDVEQVGKTKGKGSTHMYSIFKWLQKNHVDSILEVTVVDNKEPSHSDEAIEACMIHFDVRVWNWYKVDLCCQVILNAAPNVTDVTLYSSGSNAVLKGWSSSSGLAGLRKLRRVHINVQEGLERPKRLHDYMEAFGVDLKKHKPDITFTWRPHKPDLDYDAVFAKQGTDDVVESEWMKAMKKFSSFLRTVKPTNPVAPIKIAVIDDGINATSSVMSKIQVGESFAPLSAVSRRSGAYYVPSGPHGTLMAELICEVCPVVKLYIAQLEVLPGQNGQRSFTPESATEAIKWATSQKVDIISMSWSIHSNNRTYSALEAALQNAVGTTGNHILLFCSSIDEGPTATDNTYPGKEQNCIKIGAATGKGAKLSWVSATKSDFFLPGEAIQTSPDMKAWGQTQTGIFGSSVATAIAAGLAGVFIYCDRLLATPGTPSLTEEANTDLKASSNMKKAFEHLAKGSEHNKFVQPWEHLTLPDDKPLVWDEDYDEDSTEVTRKNLEEFVKYIKK